MDAEEESKVQSRGVGDIKDIKCESEDENKEEKERMKKRRIKRS